MKLTFFGAARQVTGSSHLIEVDGNKVLIDCGLFQGRKQLEKLNRRKFPFNPADLQAVILTHSHIDHAGLLPRLYSQGFRGKIFATSASADLCSVMLPDSAHIQTYDAELLNRKGKRRGRPPVEPLYTIEEAAECLKLFSPKEYKECFSPISGIQARFLDAGHILGSSFVELTISEKDKEEFTIVFSGDLGQSGQPIINDPSLIRKADYLVTEGTYGDKVHTDVNREDELARIINTTIDRKGHVVIPSFAVGRAQILLYELYKLMKAGKIPWIPVYLDSPLAVAATKITMKHAEDFDEEARKMLGNAEQWLSNFHFTSSVEESRAINDIPGGAVIISASGMADAGRIRHHLKYNLWKPECSVIFVGYQAEGTLGRQLIEGRKKVRILGETITVEAEIHKLEGFSAHADKEEIIDWLGHFSTTLKEIFLVHGEEEVLMAFSEELKKKLKIPVSIPYLGDQYEVLKEKITYVGSTLSASEELEPDMMDMFHSFESDYRNYREILLNRAVKHPTDSKEVAQRLARIKRFLRKSIDELDRPE
ncbi:MAG: MBL fold metallo-hydrolase [Negativicutes bacterium]|nr:MBL fold metallo-hydrolase [Negativicutes bacterium]